MQTDTITLEEIREAEALLTGSAPEKRVYAGGELRRAAEKVKSGDWKYHFRRVPTEGGRVVVCEAVGPYFI